MSKARHIGFSRLTQQDVAAAASRHELLYSGRPGGARAVFIGRPYLYALAAGGQAGVIRCVEILETEVRIAMALLGSPTVAGLTRDRVI